MKLLADLGEYLTMIKKMLSRPEKFSMYYKETIRQIDQIGIGSLLIISIVSIFIGAVAAVQFGYQFENLTMPIPMSFLGYVVRESMILEFAPTISCLLLAGKVGSNISTELGTMRNSEQIDALEVMGINSKNYLIFPKIIAMLTYPFVIAISMFLGITGAYTAAVLGGFVTSDQFITGLQDEFIPFHLTYAFIKTFLFAFILATVPAYHGYYMKGGALEVGEASTTSFVWTSVVLIVTNYVVTQLLLS